MNAVEAAVEVASHDPTIKSFAQQRHENKLAKQKLAGTQWEYGKFVDPDRYTQTDKVRSTVYDPPKAGVGPSKPLSKSEMFAMKQKFKYGDGRTPWADHGGTVRAITTTEKDRQREIQAAMKTISHDETRADRARGKTMKAELTRTQWTYGEEDHLDERQRSSVMRGNDQTMQAIAAETASKEQNKQGAAAQRAENLRRRKVLAGTNWSLGSDKDMVDWKQALSTETQTQFMNHLTPEGVADMQEFRKKGKVAKAKLQKTMWEYGNDPDFL